MEQRIGQHSHRSSHRCGQLYRHRHGCQRLYRHSCRLRHHQLPAYYHHQRPGLGQPFRMLFRRLERRRCSHSAKLQLVQRHLLHQYHNSYPIGHLHCDGHQQLWLFGHGHGQCHCEPLAYGKHQWPGHSLQRGCRHANRHRRIQLCMGQQFGHLRLYHAHGLRRLHRNGHRYPRLHEHGHPSLDNQHNPHREHHRHHSHLLGQQHHADRHQQHGRHHLRVAGPLHQCHASCHHRRHLFSHRHAERLFQQRSGNGHGIGHTGHASPHRRHALRCRTGQPRCQQS